MSLVCVFPGSRLEPAEYVSTEPVHCVRCGWDGDAEANAGEYHILHGIPAGYREAVDGDAICHDCSLYCEGCGEDLLDRSDFIGAAVDGTLYCWWCMADALAPEAL